LKKIIIFIALLGLIGTPVYADTMALSGSTINLEILSATASTELADSTTAVHEQVIEVRKDTAGLQTSVTKDSTNIVSLKTSITQDSTNVAAIKADTEGLQLSVTQDSTQVEAIKLDTESLQLSITQDSTQVEAIKLDTESLQLSVTQDSTQVEAIKLDTESLQLSATQDSTTNEATNAIADKVVAGAGVFFEQDDVAITVTALSDSGTTVLNLRTAGTRYIVRNMRIKSADPGANTITVRLYEFINDVFLEVDSFDITTLTFASYFNLYDMFGETQLAGDNLWITVETDAGTAAITGQYSWAKTNN
jgi:hypothetical protein